MCFCHTLSWQAKMQGFSCLVFLLLLKTMSYLDAGFKADGAASTVIKIAQVPLKGVFIITPWYLFINTSQAIAMLQIHFSLCFN